MILNSLRLTNFGNFKGVQEFMLRPRQNRPIVLFGGKNGAGKSTILDAIRLCFYGPQALGLRISKEQYLSYLRGKIHRNPNLIIQPNYASVSLEFEFADLHGIHNYRITRDWEDHGTKIVEDFKVEQDGRMLDEVSSDHWQDFVRDLIPMGVSQLFFFDGEKIQQLAEDSSDQGALMAAVKLLLGIDIVERLDTDLGVYLSRTLAQRRNKEENKLAIFEAELKATRTILDSKRDNKAALEKELLERKRTVDILEQQLASSGGNFARNRESCLRDQQRVRADLAQARSELRDLSADLLPFSLCHELCLKLKRSLEIEERNAELEAASLFATRAAEELRQALPEATDIWPQGADLKSRKKLAERVAEKLLSMVNPVKMSTIHGCSAEQRTNLLLWIQRATGDVPRRVQTLSKQIERLSKDEHRLESELKKIPSEDSLKPLLSRLQQAYKELAEKDHEIGLISSEIQSLENNAADLSRKCKDESDKILSNSAEESRIAIVPKVRSALEQFKSALIQRKIRALEDSVTQCFNVLCRKKDSMRRISIDPTTFAVTIRDKDGHPIGKNQLSAGEKQVYAISMLWALGRTSGRPLPVIVDTPLARLDRDHRSLLAEYYFPSASHQVLILSTDTEVDEQYFERLTPAVSKAYLLNFDQDERFTSVTPGYFWREREALQA